MTGSTVVAGRYRLDGLAQPEDPCTHVATDLIERQPVLVCLVTADASGAARTRRSIEHPALLRVRDVVHGVDRAAPPLEAVHGRASGFVVIDLPEAETLAGRVARKGKLELPPAVRTVIALSNALAAIHAEGAIHGSVVPEAIELRELEDGGPRLGLAGVSDLSLAYESPPRLCGEGPSEADDVWGLLGCLYFAVAGAPPFSAESPAALARRILGGRPMPLAQGSSGAAALQKIFDRGFSRTAALRYASADELREELRAWLSRHATHSDAPMVSVAPPPNPATTTARRRQSLDAELLKKALPSDRPLGSAPIKLANRPLDRPSDRPPPTVPRPPADERPTEGAIPASRRSDPVAAEGRLASDYPNLTPREPRNQTAPWSEPPRASSPPRKDSEPAPPVALVEVDPRRPATAWPGPARREEPPDTPRSAGIPARAPTTARPGTASPSEPTLTAIPRSRVLASQEEEPAPTPSSAPSVDPTVSDETVRISRDQLLDLETLARASPASEAALSAARPAAEGVVAEDAPPVQPTREIPADPTTRTTDPPARALPAAPSSAAPSKTGTVAAFVAGVAVAGALGVAYVSQRTPPGPPPRPDTPVSAAAVVTKASAAPVAAPSHAPPAATSSAPARAEEPLGACVARWFPPETFETSADLSWVCDATDGRRAQRDMQRAVVAGGRGLRVTEGMRDWARYRWFQYPVLLTLRNACCPSPAKLELPRGSPACPSATESITPLSEAAARRGGDLEAPIRQLRRMASCMAETGDAAFFALEGPMSGGEESLFRAFVERGRR
ncbi:MAG: hypothetical protein IT374_06080 [Polyangiaceae bacterium]|nr:hypothetical protein [Polyangiaceae bacterium]